MRARTIASILLLLLGGCAARASTQPAYVNVQAAMRADPLYGTLAQYDRQIAALDATMHTGFSQADAMIDNASRAVDRTASSASHTILPAKVTPPGSLASRISNTSSASSSNNDIAQHIVDTYQSQHSELQGAAQQDMSRYRNALAQQQQAAYDSFVSSIDGSSARAVDLRAQVLREQESNLLLELARQHAPQRLALRTKLQTLMLRPEQKAPLLHQLALLQNQEDSALAAARKRDAATLSAYRSSVVAHAQSEIAAFRSDLETRAAANLATREHVLQEQAGAPSSLALPKARPTGTSTANAAMMRLEYSNLTQANVPAPDFGPAASDLRSQWQSLRNAHDNDTSHTASQIADLRHDREAVLKRITSQVIDEANRIAHQHGYDSVVAGRGSPDITGAVVADLHSLLP